MDQQKKILVKSYRDYKNFNGFRSLAESKIKKTFEKYRITSGHRKTLFEPEIINLDKF